MKTWEMIKELTENPEKRFGREDGLIVGTDDCGLLHWESGRRYLSIDDKWEEVRKSVLFIEVVIAAKKGNRVGLDYDKFSLEFAKWELGDLLIALAEDFVNEDLAEIILKGKWYIED